MKGYSRKSLRITIYISIFLLLMAMGTGIIFIVYRSQVKHNMASIQKYNDGLADFIAESIRFPLKAKSYYLLQEIYSGIKNIPSLVYFDIYDQDGESFLPDSGTIRGKTFDRSRETFSIEDGTIISEREVLLDDEHLGTVIIASSVKWYQREALIGLLEIVYALGFGFFFIGFIIVFFMEKHFISPIVYLSKAAEAVGDGYFITIKRKDRKDEIGNLINTFNKMSKNVERMVEERTYELSSKNDQLQKEIVRRITLENRLKEVASKDPLTNILNRYAFEKRLTSWYMEGRGPLSLIMFDLDRFKRVNDTYGHMMGDNVLKKAVNLAEEELSRKDLFCRWGGEEFLIASHNNLEEALKTAEKIRERFDNCIYQMETPKIVKFTASFGVAELSEGESLEDLFIRVDDLMYKAKRAGRNCVVSNGS